MGLLLLMSKTGNPLVLPGAVATWDMVTMVDSQTVMDISGNGNHLALGATSGVDANDPTNAGNSFSFSTDDYMRWISPITPDATQDVTMIAVVNLSLLTGNPCFIQWDDTFGLNFSSTTNQPQFAFRTGASTYTTAQAAAVGTGTWLFLAGVKRSGSISMFLGDVKTTLATPNDTPHFVNATNFYVGALKHGANAPARFFNGSLAYANFLPRAASDGELATLHANLKSSLAARTPAIGLS